MFAIVSLPVRGEGAGGRCQVTCLAVWHGYIVFAATQALQPGVQACELCEQDLVPLGSDICCV